MTATGMHWSTKAPWLQSLPPSWTVERFRRVLTLWEERNEDGSDGRLLSLSTRSGVIPKTWDDESQVRSGDDLRKYWLVRPGHIIVNPMWVMNGAVAASEIAGVISPDYRVYSATEHVWPRFIHYLLHSREYMSLYALLTRGSTTFDRRISKVDFHELPTIVPPPETQKAIVAFLDRKTAAIDALIDKKQKLLGLLAEKRAALINQAVTKGLDTNVPMKDSGIPWIGEIPAHWEVSRVKRELQNLNYRRIPLSTTERSGRQGPFPYYGASSVIDHVDDYLFDETTILVAEDGANLVLRNLPLAIVATGKYWVNNHAHILSPPDSVVFWAALLESLDYRPFITGSAQPKLTAEALGNVVIAVPPIAEREQIAEHVEVLEKATTRPVRALAKQLARLQEYRQALITAAVTGQLDITEEDN